MRQLEVRCGANPGSRVPVHKTSKKTSTFPVDRRFPVKIFLVSLDEENLCSPHDVDHGGAHGLHTVGQTVLLTQRLHEGRHLDVVVTWHRREQTEEKRRVKIK